LFVTFQAGLTLRPPHEIHTFTGYKSTCSWVPACFCSSFEAPVEYSFEKEYQTHTTEEQISEKINRSSKTVFSAIEATQNTSQSSSEACALNQHEAYQRNNISDSEDEEVFERNLMCSKSDIR